VKRLKLNWNELYFSFSSSWRSLLQHQASFGDECGRLFQLFSAAGEECQQATVYVIEFKFELEFLFKVQTMCGYS
jgi:hypothetical protein